MDSRWERRTLILSSKVNTNALILTDDAAQNYAIPISQTITVGWSHDTFTEPFNIVLVYLGNNRQLITATTLATSVITTRDESQVQHGTITFAATATGEIQMLAEWQPSTFPVAIMFSTQLRVEEGFAPWASIEVSLTSQSVYQDRFATLATEPLRPLPLVQSPTVVNLVVRGSASSVMPSESSTQNVHSESPNKYTNVAGVAVGAVVGAVVLLIIGLIGLSRRRRRTSRSLPHPYSPSLLPTLTRPNKPPLTSPSHTTAGAEAEPQLFTHTPPPANAGQEHALHHFVTHEQDKPPVGNGSRQPQPELDPPSSEDSSSDIPGELGPPVIEAEVLAIRAELLTVRHRLAMLEAAESPPDYTSTYTRRSE
ncbi:hypothetical protein PM082_021930 [Marasmius tenuissimus]|nr:hypothetical protein PM082_021930 [Marasmius tenuissimus]